MLTDFDPMNLYPAVLNPISLSHGEGVEVVSGALTRRCLLQDLLPLSVLVELAAVDDVEDDPLLLPASEETGQTHRLRF